MTQTKLHTLNYRNAITERDRAHADRMAAIELAQPLPQPPDNNSYTGISVEPDPFDYDGLIVRATFSDGCHNRAVSRKNAPVVAAWARGLGVEVL